MILYPYALPLLYIPLTSFKSLPKKQPKLWLKVITFGKASTSSPYKRGVKEQIQEQN